MTRNRAKLGPMDALDLLGLPTRLFKARCRIPRQIESVTHHGPEVRPHEAGSRSADVESVWRATESLYRSGLYPAIQLCIRRHGGIVLNRAIGHSHGNAPGVPREARKIPVSVDTPFVTLSASKAMTAMLIHKLDTDRVLHLDDRVCDYIPEFARHGKEGITIRQVLGHRAGIPNIPPRAFDLSILDRPDRIVEILSDLSLRWRPGRWLGYHAVTGGFVLGEVVRRATGQNLRTIMEKVVREPLGFRWMNYGVESKDVSAVAENAFTGLPVFPPFSTVLHNAFGMSFREAIEISNDPRFLTGIVPAANIVANAVELSAFFQCLLEEGSLGGTRVFEPRTVRHATQENSYWELDLTLGLPIRYGVGMMLGSSGVSLFGVDNEHAFGHIGFTNILAWADPDRALSVALLTSGKPCANIEIVRLFNVLGQVGRAFPKV